MAPIQSSLSKLPREEESIFSIMSSLARQNNAVDLSQGYPNFETDEYLKDLVNQAMGEGYNQYAPLAGLMELRSAITKKILSLHGQAYNEETEITITNGATQALFLAITAFVHPKDEVVVLKPAYDSYEPAIELNGGVPVLVPLKDDYSINWQLLKDALTPKTRMLILNTPHNPSGRVMSESDMIKLEEILKDTDIILLSDEVYEHIIYDGRKHRSASSFSGLAQRSIVSASFGKTFHNTGWKMGYCVAPDYLMKEIRKVHQVNVFCVNHPMQKAFAEYLRDPSHYLNLGNFYQKKRDQFLEMIKGSKFKGIPSQGTYFQLLDYSSITGEDDMDFATRLVKEYGLAAIPVSGFNINRENQYQLRFCFAKTEETLEKAAEILNRF